MNLWNPYSQNSGSPQPNSITSSHDMSWCGKELTGGEIKAESTDIIDVLSEQGK